MKTSLMLRCVKCGRELEDSFSREDGVKYVPRCQPCLEQAMQPVGLKKS